MFNAETLIQFATDAFRSVVTQHEFHLNLCRTVLGMVEQGRLALNLPAAPYFAIKVDEEVLYTPTVPRCCLPSALELMPEHKKARLRASYARAKQIYRPNAAYLSSEQRTGEPVKLSGPNATTNVALWPTAMQVNLGHDYKGGQYSTPVSYGNAASCTNSKSDLTVKGAIDVLSALVQGLDEKWLETPGTTKRSRMFDTREMTPSYTQEKLQASSAMPKSRLTRSYGQIRFSTPSQGTHHYPLALPGARSDEYLEFTPRRRNGTAKVPLKAYSYVQSNSSTGIPQPAPSWKETYDAEPHNKDRLYATFERLRTVCRPRSDSRLTLHGSDGEMNVALYPRVTLDRLDLDEEDKLKGTKAIVRGHTETIEGAIDRLNALIQGVGYNWISPSRLTDAPAKSTVTPPRSTHSRIPTRLTCPDASRIIQPYVLSRDSTRSAPSRNEIHESSTHNKDRLRATFERVQNIYRPGSCMHPAGQNASSNSKLGLHGADGTLNIALYPRAMLVRLNVDEEDNTGAADSIIQDAAGTVEGAIDRLNSLVQGAAYEWLGIELPDDISSECAAAEPMRSTCSTISSRSSTTSGTSTSSLSQLVTPLDLTFPLGITHGSRKF